MNVVRLYQWIPESAFFASDVHTLMNLVLWVFVDWTSRFSKIRFVLFGYQSASARYDAEEIKFIWQFDRYMSNSLCYSFFVKVYEGIWYHEKPILFKKISSFTYETMFQKHWKKSFFSMKIWNDRFLQVLGQVYEIVCKPSPPRIFVLETQPTITQPIWNPTRPKVFLKKQCPNTFLVHKFPKRNSKHLMEAVKIPKF